jgi:transposase
MSNELRAQDLLPPEIGLTLMGFEKSEQGWLVRAEGRAGSECASCRRQSTARHSRYWRQLQDLPVQGKREALQLQLSRWRCRNRECEILTSCRRLRVEAIDCWLRSALETRTPKNSLHLSFHSHPRSRLRCHLHQPSLQFAGDMFW